MAELVEASDNVVFVLVLNTVRRLYLEHAELLRAVVADRDDLAPLYAARREGDRRRRPRAARRERSRSWPPSRSGGSWSRSR